MEESNVKMAAASGAAPADINAVLEELMEEFGKQHTWITSVAAAAFVQKAIGKLSLASPQVAPAGWQLVPTEITEEMHVAAVKTATRCTGNDDFPPRVYRAMLAAAPAVPVKADPVRDLLPTDAMIHAAVNAYETSQATSLVRMRCAISAALARQSAPGQAKEQKS